MWYGLRHSRYWQRAACKRFWYCRVNLPAAVAFAVVIISVHFRCTFGWTAYLTAFRWCACGIFPIMIWIFLYTFGVRFAAITLKGSHTGRSTGGLFGNTWSIIMRMRLRYGIAVIRILRYIILRRVIGISSYAVIDVVVFAVSHIIYRIWIILWIPTGLSAATDCGA